MDKKEWIEEKDQLNDTLKMCGMKKPYRYSKVGMWKNFEHFNVF